MTREKISLALDKTLMQVAPGGRIDDWPAIHTRFTNLLYEELLGNSQSQTQDINQQMELYKLSFMFQNFKQQVETYMSRQNNIIGIISFFISLINSGALYYFLILK